MLLWQKPLSYESSLGVILKIMFSCYKPMKYMVIICIITSIIYAFNTHGKYSNPQTHHLNYDAIIRNHKHYLQYGIHHSKSYLQRYFETCPIVSNITTNCPRPTASIYENPKNIY